MERYSIDCRDNLPSDVKCTLAFFADTKEELIEVVMDHGVKVHGMVDTPEVRKNLEQEFRKGEVCS